MADPAKIDVERLAEAIRTFAPNRRYEDSRKLAQQLIDAPVLSELTREVQKTRDTEYRYLSYGKNLVDTLEKVTHMVEACDSTLACEIHAILSQMWNNIAGERGSRPASLWNSLSRAEQEEYRDLHYEAGDLSTDREARMREIEAIARDRVDNPDEQRTDQ